MDNLDQEYQKRFSLREVPTPDADALWADIADKLDRNAAVAPRNMALGSAARWLIGISVVLLSGLTAMLVWPNQQSGAEEVAIQNQVPVQQAKRPNETPSGDVTTIETAAAQSGQEYSLDQTGFDVSKRAIQSYSGEENGWIQPDKPALQTVPAGQVNHIPASKYTENEPFLSVIKPEYSASIHPQADLVTHNSAAQEPDAKDIPAQPLAAASSALLQPVFLPVNQKHLVFNQHYMLPELAVVADFPFKKTNQNSYWQAGVNVSLNAMLFRYSDASQPMLAQSKQEAENMLASAGGGVSLARISPRNWMAETGIEYQRYWTKFEFEQVKTIKVLKENQLLEVVINSVTGDTLQKVYGDTLIDGISTRQVVHYNRYQQLTLPLLVGWRQHNGKWAFDMATGPVLSWSLQQSGKTIDADGAIIGFDKNSEMAPLAALALGWRVRSSVGYQINQQWMVSVQPQWMWQQRRNLANSDLRAGTHQFNLNLSVSKRL